MIFNKYIYIYKNNIVNDIKLALDNSILTVINNDQQNIMHRSIYIIQVKLSAIKKASKRGS